MFGQQRILHIWFDDVDIWKLLKNTNIQHLWLLSTAMNSFIGWRMRTKKLKLVSFTLNYKHEKCKLQIGCFLLDNKYACHAWAELFATHTFGIFSYDSSSMLHLSQSVSGSVGWTVVVWNFCSFKRFNLFFSSNINSYKSCKPQRYTCFLLHSNRKYACYAMCPHVDMPGMPIPFIQNIYLSYLSHFCFFNLHSLI